MQPLEWRIQDLIRKIVFPRTGHFGIHDSKLRIQGWKDLMQISESRIQMMASNAVLYIISMNSYTSDALRTACELLLHFIPHAISTLGDEEWCDLIQFALLEFEQSSVHDLIEFIFMEQHSRLILLDVTILSPLSKCISFSPDRFGTLPTQSPSPCRLLPYLIGLSDSCAILAEHVEDGCRVEFQRGQAERHKRMRQMENICMDVMQCPFPIIQFILLPFLF